MKARLPKGVGGGPGNVNDMLRQAHKMQADIEALQADLDEREYTANAGGGMVEVTVTGKHQIRTLKINPDAIDPDDREMLEDLVAAAVNEAMRLADETAEQEMRGVTGGLDLPGMR